MTADLDIEQPVQLLAYLRQAGHIGATETPAMHTLTGGVSNRTVLVEREYGEAWVLKQALAKLRVQVDWFSPPERVHREALGLRWLEQLAPPGTITPLIFEDFDHHLIGMVAVPQPHENWKTMLLRGDLQRNHIEQFARLLGTVHRESAKKRQELTPIFGDRGYFESLRLEPYYGYTASQVEQARPFLEALLSECRATTQTLVHGDYSPKNVLVHEGQLVLLDHEVIHFGDPGFDLGFSLTHLLSKAHHLPGMQSAFQSAAIDYWNTYWNIVYGVDWSDGLEQRAVRHTLGCLLARVRGRSPLEYLSTAERDCQAAAVISLMDAPPRTVADLASDFLAAVAERE